MTSEDSFLFFSIAWVFPLYNFIVQLLNMDHSPNMNQYVGLLELICASSSIPNAEMLKDVSVLYARLGRNTKHCPFQRVPHWYLSYLFASQLQFCSKSAKHNGPHWSIGRTTEIYVQPFSHNFINLDVNTRAAPISLQVSHRARKSESV